MIEIKITEGAKKNYENDGFKTQKARRCIIYNDAGHPPNNCPQRNKKGDSNGNAFSRNTDTQYCAYPEKTNCAEFKEKQASGKTRKKRSRESRIPCQGQMYAV